MPTNAKEHPLPLYRRPSVVLAGIVVLVVVCFYPLTQYFFAQDDFILLLKSSEGIRQALADQFGAGAGQFRPLTKVLYFAVTYPMFGLNAFPYHLISLLLHIANVLLMFALLRRFKVGDPAALIITSFFALHAGFLNVVGWISCIQPLLGEFFALLALNAGVRAVDTRRAVYAAAASVFYLLALMSMEQTWAVGALLFLYSYFESKPHGRRAGYALGRSWPFVAILVVYVVFMAGWKGIPRGGAYAASLGTQTITNLLTYVSWVFDISVIMPFAMNAVTVGFGISHVFVLMLILYDLSRGRGVLVVLGLVYYFLAILPAAALREHTFLNHNYIPSLGMLLLLAPATEDFARFVGGWRPRLGVAFPAVLAALLGVVCFSTVRINQTNYVREVVELPKNFVFRRAIVAKHAYQDIVSKRLDEGHSRTLYMIYVDEKSWYGDNVAAALGGASGPRLFWSSPHLEVHYLARGDTIQSYEPDATRVLFYDHMGRVYTSDEVNKRGGSAIREIDPE